MQSHSMVSRKEWTAARKALLAREKELTRARDADAGLSSRCCHGSAG